MPEQTTPSLPPPAGKPPAEDDLVFHASFLEQPPLWKQLWEGLQDLVHPPKQPELKLESTPIPVKDIWSKDEKSLVSKASSIVIHVLVLVLIMVVVSLKPVRQKIVQVATPIFVPPPEPPPPPDVKVLKLAKGSGPAIHSPKPISVPQIAHVLTAPSSIVPLSTAMSAPSNALFFGNGPAVGPPGPGNGTGGGGNGGAGGNCDPAVESDCVIGEGISAPVPISSPDPEYSEEARKAKFQGTVNVKITIGADGKVTDAEIVQPLGLGLDQKALEAVRTWTFIPAKYHGKPIAISAIVEVNFHLY